MNLPRLPSSSTQACRDANSPRPSAQNPGQKIPFDGKLDLEDFLAFHDQDFIDAAYRGLLGRDADPTGRTHFLDSLRAGRLSKTEILGRLRYSPEGRKKNMRVAGLRRAFLAQRACRVPIAGWLFALVAAPANLSRMQSRLQELEARLHAAEKCVALLNRRAVNLNGDAAGVAATPIPDIPPCYIGSDVDAALQEIWDIGRNEA